MPRQRKPRVDKIPPLDLHPLCRPPPRSFEIRQMRPDGKWGVDNGRPARAFIGLDHKDRGTPMESAIVWVADCSCDRFVDCPVSKALDKACDLFGAASIVRVKAVR